MKIRDFVKNIKDLFNKLINEGEVEEVELTGILSEEPKFLKNFKSLEEAEEKPKTKGNKAKTNTKVVSAEEYVAGLKARPAKQKNTTPKTQPNVNNPEKDDNELSL